MGVSKDMAVALGLSLLNVYSLLSQNELDIQTIVNLVLLSSFYSYQGILEIHN